ncbi:hypothetical protein DE146DRAFT_787696 [Phaeosphaeria sp. MPI-PUGE-AT-0046c]|nr:hypothetical protein DE146DRAFT_787696 [Phaeosphaeria sp. MPI-PUGE-AT-0046c]
MKFTTGSILGLCLIGLKAVGVFSAALEPNLVAGLDRNSPENHAALEAECGDLGVMEVPEGAGVDQSKVRHCAGHPNGRSRFPDINGNSPSGWDAYIASVEDTNPADNINVDDRRDPPPASSGAGTPKQLFGRGTAVCMTGQYNYGCNHGGYCWRVCGGEGDYKPWCWLAWSGSGWGNGPWMRCKRIDDCNEKKGGECCTGHWSCGCDCRNK